MNKYSLYVFWKALDMSVVCFHTRIIECSTVCLINLTNSNYTLSEASQIGSCYRANVEDHLYIAKSTATLKQFPLDASSTPEYSAFIRFVHPSLEIFCGDRHTDVFHILIYFELQCKA